LVDTLAYGNDLADEVAVSGDEAGQLLVRDLMSHGYGATLETTGASFTRYVKEWSSDPVDRLFADSQAGTMDLYFEETPMVRWSDPADWFNISNLSTAEIQAAIDAGTRTLYLPAGSRVELDAPLYFRQGLERFVGMGNSAGLFGTSANSLVIDDSSAEAMIFEFLENGDAFGETVSNMLHIAEATPAIIFQGHIVGLRSLGAGPIFIDGLEAGSRIHPFTFAGGGHVYARSYNNEVGDVFTEVRNATEMVILGYKTEQPGPVLHLSEGSRVEVLGAHIFPVRSAAADPMIISTDAEVTFSFFEDLLNEPYATLARETRQGETRLREREGLGNAGVTRFFPNRGSVSALFSGQRSGPYYTPRPLLQGALIVDDWETFGSAFWYQPVQGNPAVDGWSYHPDWGFIWIFRGGIENVYLWQGDEATWRYTNETLYPWSYHYALDEWQWR